MGAHAAGVHLGGARACLRFVGGGGGRAHTAGVSAVWGAAGVPPTADTPAVSTGEGLTYLENPKTLKPLNPKTLKPLTPCSLHAIDEAMPARMLTLARTLKEPRCSSPPPPLPTHRQASTLKICACGIPRCAVMSLATRWVAVAVTAMMGTAGKDALRRPRAV